MNRIAEYVGALAVASAGVSAMVWWPDPSEPWPPEVAIADAADAADTNPPVISETAEPVALPAVASLPELPPGPALDTRLGLTDPEGAGFDFLPPGRLVEGAGEGLAATMVHVPGVRFPLESAPAYANSLAWGVGGFHGTPGDQCAPENYAYPWRDSFCEATGHGAAICPAGTGHSGQDLRPAHCERGTHWAVAAADGVITSVGAYSVRLMSETGVRFTYLHLDPASLAIETGDTVRRGERIGQVSNAFGHTPALTHLHFEIRIAVDAGEAGLINTPVPPYASLVEAYQRLLAGEEADQGA